MDGSIPSEECLDGERLLGENWIKLTDAATSFLLSLAVVRAMAFQFIGSSGKVVETFAKLVCEKLEGCESNHMIGMRGPFDEVGNAGVVSLTQ